MTSAVQYRFFHEWAGGIVGEAAIGALELARAESRLEAMQDNGEDVAAWWEDDLEPYDAGTVDSPEDVARRLESGEWTGPFGCVVRVGETTVSLWGIVLGSRGVYDRYACTYDPYARVVMAELASEAFADVDRETAERNRAARADIATTPA